MTDKLVQQSSRHGIYVQRVGGGIANKFDEYIELLKKEIRSIMFGAPDTTQNTKIINKIIREISSAQKTIYANYNLDILLGDLKEFSSLESAWQLSSLESVISSKSIELIASANNQIWAAVNAQPLLFPSTNGIKLIDLFIKDIEAIEIKRITDMINFGFMTGRTSQQITRDLTSKKGALDNITRRNIKSMVRTSTNHVSNVARQKTLSDNDDIIVGYEWISTLDGRTSTICQQLSGTIFKTNDKNKRVPPAHPNCRSSITPVLDHRYAIDNSNATQSSKGVTGGKQVSANLTYYEWLKEQGKQGKNGRAFVQDVLGKERANLFLNDNLSVKEFKALTIDQHFRPIPLNELKNKQSLQLALDD